MRTVKATCPPIRTLCAGVSRIVVLPLLLAWITCKTADRETASDRESPAATPDTAATG